MCNGSCGSGRVSQRTTWKGKGGGEGGERVTYVKERDSQRKRRVVLIPVMSDPQWLCGRDKNRFRDSLERAGVEKSTHETKLGELKERKSAYQQGQGQALGLKGEDIRCG